MSDIHGACDARFEPVREAFRACFDEHGDLGASCAVTLGGELMVDLWGGHVDEARTTPWAPDTIVNVWSTTKTMAALTLLVLADRGALDLDAPVARYWPEFAVNGKEGVLVRHVLGHTAGLPGWSAPMVPADLVDHDRCAGRLAEQAPWWEPGTVSGYHAITQGYLENELVRRVTGSTLGAFFANEIAGPLGADFHIGLAPEHDHRVSPVVTDGVESPGDDDPSSVASRVMSNPALDPLMSNEISWRRAELPAVNGHGNARSVALVQSAVAGRGTARGVRLLSPSTVERIFEVQAEGVDLVLGLPMRLGIGYGLVGPDVPLTPNPHTCFWGGWGGSLVIDDLDAEMTVAYVMNRMSGGTLGDPRGIGIVFAAYAALAG